MKIPVYIPSTMNKTLNNWCGYSIRNKSRAGVQNTVYDFMEFYEQSQRLYNRIVFMTILINKYKNDKLRKKAAREKLLEAQNGTALLTTLHGPYCNTKYRQDAYRALINAENFIREDNKFIESISRFDYTNDGINEYVCRMKSYFSYISLLGGSIQELDVMKNCGNYADNLNRIFEYDGAEDGYKRGLLVDHLFDNEQFTRYINGEAAGDGVFSRIIYKEVKFSASKNELLLVAEAEYKPTHQKVSLRKKYIFNSNGMTVQYILKNDSPKTMNLKLAVESNFCDVNFESEKVSYFNIEAAQKDQVYVLEPKKAGQIISKTNELNDVQVIRLTDTVKGVSFSFEPNEGCGYYYCPLIFKRPDYETSKLVTSAATFVSTMFWNIDIESGKETEKTVNFTITSVKKEKSKQST